MLRRKITDIIEEHLRSDSKKMLVVDGARQIGKSYIIRYIGSKMFENFIELNMEEDKSGDRLFANATTTEKFYLALSAVAGDKMKERENTLVFIDEIQAYDHLLTLSKFLTDDARFTYIASGSLLGVTLKKTESAPAGSIEQLHMYPLDFEEFLWANNIGQMLIDKMHECYDKQMTLDTALHDRIIDLFKRYLLVGGLPDAVNQYISEHNIIKVRKSQDDVHAIYISDAAKYENESSKKLKIQRIYGMIPSNLENRKKRIIVKDIEDKKGKRTNDYQDEFDYLVSSGIALEVDAISQPTYPLVQNAGKNLLKLYMNDVGIFTGILYHNNIRPILEDIRSINLGAVYETVVAQELRAHGFGLYYYDNKSNGEVDFLIDDVENMSTLPIEVKSGKDYKEHSALNHFLSIKNYNIHKAYVLSNENVSFTENGITYMPIYNIMFISPEPAKNLGDLTI